MTSGSGRAAQLHEEKDETLAVIRNARCDRLFTAGSITDSMAL
jgi:hypothetical protein